MPRHAERINRRFALSEVHVEPPAGDAGVAEAAGTDLFAVLYAQLRQMAQSALRRSGSPLALSPTTLLHEAYIDISSRDSLRFPDRARFMAYASRAMRGLIVDYVREGRAQKRGSAFAITTLPTELEQASPESDRLDLTRISDALDELSHVDIALAELVDLKFFCGFSLGEIAAMRCVSERTVQRDWEKARLLLYRSML
jgi:RNA polymerase sigma factor (TIGR02999 family)